MKAAALGALTALALILATVGPPRLIGTGCANRPLGITLAREESDFPACRSIRPIWSNHNER